MLTGKNCQSSSDACKEKGWRYLAGLGSSLRACKYRGIVPEVWEKFNVVEKAKIS
jgi:hypothetical protein